MPAPALAVDHNEPNASPRLDDDVASGLVALLKDGVDVRLDLGVATEFDGDGTMGTEVK